MEFLFFRCLNILILLQVPVDDDSSSSGSKSDPIGLLRDPFWKNLEAGRIDVFEGGDMYSKVKGRATRPPSYNENALTNNSDRSVTRSTRRSQESVPITRATRKGRKRRSQSSIDLSSPSQDLASENNSLISENSNSIVDVSDRCDSVEDKTTTMQEDAVESKACAICQEVALSEDLQPSEKLVIDDDDDGECVQNYVAEFDDAAALAADKSEARNDGIRDAELNNDFTRPTSEPLDSESPNMIKTDGTIRSETVEADSVESVVLENTNNSEANKSDDVANIEKSVEESTIESGETAMATKTEEERMIDSATKTSDEKSETNDVKDPTNTKLDSSELIPVSEISSDEAPISGLKNDIGSFFSDQRDEMDQCTSGLKVRKLISAVE